MNEKRHVFSQKNWRSFPFALYNCKTMPWSQTHHIVLYHCFLYPATVCIVKYGAVQKSCLKNLLLTLFHHVLVHNISLLYHLHSIELLIFVSPSSQKYFPEKQLFITYYYSHNILINTLNYYPVMSGKIAKFHVLITWKT